MKWRPRYFLKARLWITYRSRITPTYWPLTSIIRKCETFSILGVILRQQRTQCWVLLPIKVSTQFKVQMQCNRGFLSDALGIDRNFLKFPSVTNSGLCPQLPLQARLWFRLLWLCNAALGGSLALVARPLEECG